MVGVGEGGEALGEVACEIHQESAIAQFPKGVYINAADLYDEQVRSKSATMASDRKGSGLDATTAEVSFKDAPKKPETLRMTLRDKKSLWEKLRDSVRDLSPEKLLEAISNERERIMENVRKNGRITPQEAEVLNQTARKNLRKTLDTFLDKAMKPLEIKPTDSPEEIQLKSEFTQQLDKWLSDLFQWMLNKITEIFKWIREKIEWYWEKTKELFEYLVSLISQD